MKFLAKRECDRCLGPLLVRTMSKFNTDALCMPCKDKEKLHPLYEQACAEELAAVRSGNMNFPGIGRPSDL